MYADEQAVQSAQNLRTRFSINSLFGMIYDLHVLAESDFVVCTFSSNVSQCCCAYQKLLSSEVESNYYKIEFFS